MGTIKGNFLLSVSQEGDDSGACLVPYAIIFHLVQEGDEAFSQMPLQSPNGMMSTWLLLERWGDISLLWRQELHFRNPSWLSFKMPCWLKCAMTLLWNVDDTFQDQYLTCNKGQWHRAIVCSLVSIPISEDLNYPSISPTRTWANLVMFLYQQCVYVYQPDLSLIEPQQHVVLAWYYQHFNAL